MYLKSAMKLRIIIEKHLKPRNAAERPVNGNLYFDNGNFGQYNGNFSNISVNSPEITAIHTDPHLTANIANKKPGPSSDPGFSGN